MNFNSLISKKLKKNRLMLGLTQEQMAAGVVSSSYYSKAERGQHQINMSDLLAILKIHNISLYDFFVDFPNSSVEDTLKQSSEASLLLKQLLDQYHEKTISKEDKKLIAEILTKAGYQKYLS